MFFLAGSVKRSEKVFARQDSLGLFNSENFHGNGRPIKKIIDPLMPIKIEINIPISKIISNIDLPCSQEKEIADPTKGIIEKKAHRIIRARIRKMKKHRYKKWLKKHKALLLRQKTAMLNKRLKDLKVNKRRFYNYCVSNCKLNFFFFFKEYLGALDAQGASFSVKNYMEEKLEMYNWVQPRTCLHGQRAPEWAIKEWYQKKAEQKRVKERVNYSLFIQDLKKA